MTPWRWHVGYAHEVEAEGLYNLDECDTREVAIRSGLADTNLGEAFYIIEARSSTAQKHEGSECVPFLRKRNEERFVNGPAAHSEVSDK